MGITKEQARKIEMHLMLPDDGKGASEIQTWHRATKKEFLEEWKKNGIFEEVVSAYNCGNLILYIRVQEQYKARLSPTSRSEFTPSHKRKSQGVAGAEHPAVERAGHDIEDDWHGRKKRKRKTAFRLHRKQCGFSKRKS